MLTLSHDAAKLIADAKSRAEVPEAYGLRLLAEPAAQGTSLAIAFAPEPEEGDEVSEQDGLPVFVAPEVAEPLADAVLDVVQTGAGLDLVVKTQAEAGEIPGFADVREDVSPEKKDGELE